MSSGNNYERVVKLWISLWNLVLESKRQLEAVCAVLQQLVFEFKGYPTHKNWPEICKISKINRHLMFAIACMTKNEMTSEIGKRLITLFPECFSFESITGPVPWSVLKDDCLQETIKDCGSGWEVPDEDLPNMRYMMVCRGTIGRRFFLPYQEFYIYPEYINEDAEEQGVLPLPDSIPEDVVVGTKIKWRDREWIVVENRQVCMDDDDICITPFDCIDINS